MTTPPPIQRVKNLLIEHEDDMERLAEVVWIRAAEYMAVAGYVGRITRSLPELRLGRMKDRKRAEAWPGWRSIGGLMFGSWEVAVNELFIGWRGVDGWPTCTLDITECELGLLISRIWI